MSFTVNERMAATAAGRAQTGEIGAMWRYAYNHNRQMAALVGNALPNLDPRAWIDLDAQTRTLINTEADVIFTDLMALSQSIDIGKLVAAYRRTGAMDAGDTSLSGQETHLMGKISHDYDGVVIPVHVKGYGIEWRQVEGNRTIGYDELGENNEGALREVIRLATVNFMDGKTGLNYQGANSYGIRNNPNTLAVTMTVDMTAGASTYIQMHDQLVTLVQRVRGGTNRVTQPVKVYISPEIESNWQRTTGGQTIDRTFMQGMRDIAGISDIATSQYLVGNQIILMVQSREFVAPKTGMALTTTPIPRQQPFADYQFLSWMATGLLIKADQQGRSGVLYAA